MMSAIDFDDEHSRDAGEIREVEADWMLAAKLDSGHPMHPDQFPKDPFRTGAVAAKRSCAFDLPDHAPSPNLSP
jgi:hypothetical protein